MPKHKRHRIELPFPPSVNSYWRHVVFGKSARVLVSEAGREYRERVRARLIVTALYNLRMTSRLFVMVYLSPPDNRRRDIDNYFKGLLDAITYCKTWEDDSQIDILLCVRKEVIKGGSAVVEIEELDDVQTDLFNKRIQAHDTQPF